MSLNKTKSEKLHFEPILWALFGNGGTVAALFFPILVALFGVFLVIGVYSPESLYDNLHAFSSYFLGKVIIFVLLAFNFWHACHRIYHALHDLKIHPPHYVKVGIYGFAVIMNILIIYLLL